MHVYLYKKLPSNFLAMAILNSDQQRLRVPGAPAPSHTHMLLAFPALSILVVVRCLSLGFLIRISFMTSMFLLAICMSSFLKYLLNLWPIFNFRFFKLDCFITGW